MGAFFGAMTVRASSFPQNTQWSEGERAAMKELWPLLVQVLPPDVLFIADPDGLLSEGALHAGIHFVGRGPQEMRLVGALREVLRGDHLGFEEVVGLLRDILPLQGNIGDALVGAFLICQRMNGETDRELKAYCMAFDNELGPLPVADVRSLTHYGEPYDGNTRFFRSTLFVAAVRASYGETCLIHGVEWMPPKSGITEGQILGELGAAITLPPTIAAKLLEDEDIGLAYISQREAHPSLYSLIGLRHHIKKRPTVATTEKVQHYVRATGREAMMAGFYHKGFQEPLLMLMRRRGVAAGLVIKGEEGALSLTTNTFSTDQSGKGPSVNSCAGFRPMTTTCSETRELDGVLREPFSLTISAVDYGFEPTSTPRIDRSVAKNIQLGLSALGGNKGPAYDRIIFNAAMTDFLLGCEGASTFSLALERSREAVDSGQALSRLWKFIDATKRCA
ncbi:hypothetical protein O6H91_20G015900 [Diphasiastrum complanatum]|nr:hypothetical protein O6H91_20G015900 [Diphasiastrum complanatum]